MSDTVRVFLLILSGSFFFSALVSRIPWVRIPSAVGYLGFGLLLQTPAFSLTPNDNWWLQQLGHFGLLFLMFLSGMEVDPDSVVLGRGKGGSKQPLVAAGSMFTSTFSLSLAFGLGVSWTLHRSTDPWMLALLFATTSLGVIVPILEEADLLHTDYGQILLLSALIADFVTLWLLSFVVAVHQQDGVVGVLRSLLILPVLPFVYWILVRVRAIPGLRTAVRTPQDRARAAIALVAVFSAFADCIGTEPILGSFLAGVLVSFLPFTNKQKFRDYIHGIGYGFLVPIFFVSVGTHFQLNLFRDASAWTWLLALLLISVVVKIWPARQLVISFGRQAALAGGFLLSARLSLVVAAAQIGVRIGALPRWLSELMVLVAVITSLLGPAMFSVLIQTARSRLLPSGRR